MLHVTYEAVDQPDRLAHIDEDRGRVRVIVDKAAPIAAVVQQLNTEIDQFLTTSDWYQLWRDEIISRGTPDASLSVIYLFDALEPGGVQLQERRGLVSVHIDPSLTVAEFAAAMNPATQKVLDAGCWFQHYAGEIIDNSPEPMSQV